MTSKRTRYVATHLDKALHKLVKVKCVERDLTIGEAIELGLKQVLDITEDEIEQEKLIQEAI